ncbi:MAG: DUF3379 domain-containing protein [Parashewanella sp.]
MDELEFRRRAIAEPNSKDDDFLQAIAQNANREETVRQQKAFDKKLSQALNIEPPAGMMENLILRQQLKQHHQQRRKAGFMMAMAASVAFVAGITFTLLRTAPVDLSEHAIAHVYHEDNAMTVNQHVDFKQLNNQLVSLANYQGGQFTKQPGEVYYTSYCDFQGVRSLHLVMQGKDNKVTVFIVPAEERMKFERTFSDKNYQGMGFEKDGSYMLLVGEEQQDLNYVKKEIEGTFI